MELTKLYECFAETCQSKDDQVTALRDELKELTT